MPRKNQFKIKEDLSGKTIGTNYVIGLSKNRISNRNTWVVRCLCGNIHELVTYSVKKIQGCKKCSYRGERIYRRKRPYEATYNIFVNRAKYPVSITYEQFLDLVKIKNCHYCGFDIIWSEYRTKNRGGNGSNLDRKDNLLGYTKENVVVCCGRCNYAKGSHFNYEEWLEIGKVIKTFKVRDYKITPQSTGRALALLEREIEQGNISTQNNSFVKTKKPLQNKAKKALKKH